MNAVASKTPLQLKTAELAQKTAKFFALASTAKSFCPCDFHYTTITHLETAKHKCSTTFWYIFQLDDDDDGITPWTDRTSKKGKLEPAQNKTAIDITADDILPRLTPHNVADLVLLSMVSFFVFLFLFLIAVNKKKMMELMED